MREYLAQKLGEKRTKQKSTKRVDGKWKSRGCWGLGKPPDFWPPDKGGPRLGGPGPQHLRIPRFARGVMLRRKRTQQQKTICITMFLS